LASGNGLTADVWEKFDACFRIPRIIEFYAATEGNFTLYNCEGKRGAIGRIPPFLAHRFNVRLIRLDAATDEPIRDKVGFCIRCGRGEIGDSAASSGQLEVDFAGDQVGDRDEIAQ
jgi:fatty-acyl-CoA synthase